MLRLSGLLVAILLAFVLVPRGYAINSPYPYTITDLGNLWAQYPYCAPAAINSSGQVTGESNIPPYDHGHGFVWLANGSPMVDLGALDGQQNQTIANAINDSTWIVGSSGSGEEAFLWTPQKGMQGLGFLPTGIESTLYAINNANTAVGGAMSVGGSYSHAIIWDPTNGMRDLNTLIVNPPGSWTPTAADCISQSGIIAGIGVDDPAGPPTGPQHAFVVNAGTLTEIPDPGVRIQPEAVNSAGEVVGFYLDASNHSHAFAYTPARGTWDLGSLGANARATSITEEGLIGGTTALSDGSEAAFTYSDSGGMVQLLPPDGYVFGGVEGISSGGDLIVGGYYSDGTATGGSRHHLRQMIRNRGRRSAKPRTWRLHGTSPCFGMSRSPAATQSATPNRLRIVCSR